MPEPQVDTSTAVALTDIVTVPFGIEGRSVMAGDVLVNPRASTSHSSALPAAAAKGVQEWIARPNHRR